MDFPRNALDAVRHADPYPYYARLLRERPLFFDDSLGLWVASAADVVRAALAHPALRVRPAAEQVPRALAGTPTGEVFALLVRMNDGEFHARHRPAVQARVRQFDDRAVGRAAAQAVDDLASRSTPDRLCSAIPVRAMALLLGVAPDALDATTQAVHRFAEGIGPGAAAQAVEEASRAVQLLMAQGEAEGLDAVRSANRIALMQQSLDATAGLIGNALLWLQAQPTLARHADASPDAMRSFVAEVARWDPSVQNTRRFAAADLSLGQARLRSGDTLLLVLAAANRDAALNPQPERFWPGRPEPRSLGFGAGAHGCPGERIANGIAAAALARLRQRHGYPDRALHRAGYRPLANARIPEFGTPPG
jgi:cytochrome P450